MATVCYCFDLDCSRLKFGRRRMTRCRSCSADNLDKIDEDLDNVDNSISAHEKILTDTDAIKNASK